MSAPKPLTEAPAFMAELWLAGRYIPEPAQHVWSGSDWQKRWLAQGQYFATRADAQAAMDSDAFGFGGAR